MGSYQALDVAEDTSFLVHNWSSLEWKGLDVEALSEQMMKGPWACSASLKIFRIRCVNLSSDHASNLWAMRDLIALKGLKDLCVDNIRNFKGLSNDSNRQSEIAVKDIAVMNKNETSSTSETILVKICVKNNLRITLSWEDIV